VADFAVQALVVHKLDAAFYLRAYRPRADRGRGIPAHLARKCGRIVAPESESSVRRAKLPSEAPYGRYRSIDDVSRPPAHESVHDRRITARRSPGYSPSPRGCRLRRHRAAFSVRGADFAG